MISRFSAQLESALYEPEDEVPLTEFQKLVTLISPIAQHPPETIKQESINQMFTDLFLFAYLLPEYRSDKEDRAFTSARELWDHWVHSASSDAKWAVTMAIKARLRELIYDTKVQLL